VFKFLFRAKDTDFFTHCEEKSKKSEKNKNQVLHIMPPYTPQYVKNMNEAIENHELALAVK